MSIPRVSMFLFTRFGKYFDSPTSSMDDLILATSVRGIVS